MAARAQRAEIIGLMAAVLVTGAVLVVGISAWRWSSARPNARWDAPPHFVGSVSCARCHAAADSTWTGSDHDLALQEATPATINGDFDDATFTHAGITSRFFKEDGRFFVRTDGPDGTLQTFPIAHVFGHFPLEQYLIKFPDGRLQALNLCWDKRPAEEGGQRWFPLMPDDTPRAGDPFHWTGYLQNWNFMCADCHSTHVHRNYDPATNTYNTRWVEPDVSCEACHGPASLHVRYEQNPERSGYSSPPANRGFPKDVTRHNKATWTFQGDDPTATPLGPRPSPEAMDACFRCHSRRTKLAEDLTGTAAFQTNHRLTLLEDALYHADGRNRDEVFVHGSFRQTKMFQAGVTCLDCHDAHSGKTLGTGDQVCARCHRPDVFASVEHHHHPKGQGDGCLDCHMRPVRVMGVDDRRDHGFRVPRPDLSLELGIPNACNECHTEKSARWARDKVVQWYGPEVPYHFAPALHVGRTGAPGALDSLRSLIGNEEVADIVRATAIALVPRYTMASEEPLVLEHLRGHVAPDSTGTNALLREAALRALMSSVPERRLALAFEHLDDPNRNLRLAAAELVADIRPDQVTAENRPSLEKAHKIWEQFLVNSQDRPENLDILRAFLIKQGMDSYFTRVTF